MSAYLEFDDKTGMYKSITLEQWLEKMELLKQDEEDYGEDWVRVVRCKDCKYNYLDPNDKKKCLKVDRTPDFFCADGERKEVE